MGHAAGPTVRAAAATSATAGATERSDSESRRRGRTPALSSAVPRHWLSLRLASSRPGRRGLAASDLRVKAQVRPALAAGKRGEFLWCPAVKNVTIGGPAPAPGRGRRIPSQAHKLESLNLKPSKSDARQWRATLPRRSSARRAPLPLRHALGPSEASWLGTVTGRLAPGIRVSSKSLTAPVSRTSRSHGPAILTGRTSTVAAARSGRVL
jgi:hypothetical protein